MFKLNLKLRKYSNFNKALGYKYKVSLFRLPEPNKLSFVLLT